MKSAAKPTTGNSRTLLRLARLLWFWNSSCNWGSSLFELPGGKAIQGYEGRAWVWCYGTWDTLATGWRIASVIGPTSNREEPARSLTRYVVCSLSSQPNTATPESALLVSSKRESSTSASKITKSQHILDQAAPELERFMSGNQYYHIDRWTSSSPCFQEKS